MYKFEFARLDFHSTVCNGAYLLLWSSSSSSAGCCSLPGSNVRTGEVVIMRRSFYLMKTIPTEPETFPFPRSVRTVWWGGGGRFSRVGWPGERTAGGEVVRNAWSHSTRSPWADHGNAHPSAHRLARVSRSWCVAEGSGDQERLKSPHPKPVGRSWKHPSIGTPVG